MVRLNTHDVLKHCRQTASDTCILLACGCTAIATCDREPSVFAKRLVPTMAGTADGGGGDGSGDGDGSGVGSGDGDGSGDGLDVGARHGVPESLHTKKPSVCSRTILHVKECQC